MKQYIVDAFTDTLFGGNPAAVLPCARMPGKELMQSIAIENNYSETAFVVKKADGLYDLKWFTPGGEIDLCGHATLSAAYVLSRYADPGVSVMNFDTLSGRLTVTAGDQGFSMDFPVGRVKRVPVTEEIRKASADLAREAYFDGGDTVAVVESEEALARFEPDSEAILKAPGLGFIMTAPSAQYDFVSRCFYPKLAIAEDPVTGRAHTYLAPIWAEKLGKSVFSARQISRRGGLVGVRLKGDRVELTGQVVTFMVGDIPFDL